MLKYSIASFSFHRALAAGKQDMFKYIEDCKELGMAQLDPWNGHLSVITDDDTIIKTGQDPENSALSAQTDDYIAQVKAAADAAGLPFGCVAVDGAHIYEPTPEARQTNRASAYRWLDVAQKLGAKQIRIDAGGPEELTDEIFAIIVEGYQDIIPRAQEKGLEVLIENHWGSSAVPENLVKMLDTIESLNLLFDTNNFAEGMQEKGWELCAKYARSVHVKTFAFDEQGNDPTVDLPRVIRMLVDTGYDDVWGIESVPKDGDEYGAIKQTMALIERAVNG
jgi:sugar phosphate isomerase/epimerase